MRAIDYFVAEQWTQASTAEHRPRKPATHWRGRLAELNGLMTGRGLVAYLRAKLAEHRVAKVVPPQTTLAAAYTRAYRMHHLNEGIEKLREEAAELEVGTPPISPSAPIFPSSEKNRRSAGARRSPGSQTRIGGRREPRPLHAAAPGARPARRL